MNSIQVLDTSLRDGGHRTLFHFSDDELKNILIPLDNSGIEYIEIGYRNGSLHPIDNLGRAGLANKNYLQFCKSQIKRATLTVMAHPKNIRQADLIELSACGVGLLRLCIPKNGLPPALPLIKQAQEQGLKVSVNFIHLSYYSDDELEQVVQEVIPYHPDMIYFADSNGSLFPDKVHTLYAKYTKKYNNIPFGFHAHDNLGLAQANALAAMNAGARLIDASLAGMGKGTGNLKTEFFAACLQAAKIQQYQLNELLSAANFVKDKLGIGCEAVEMDEFIRGISNLSTADLKKQQASILRAV